MTFPGRSGVPDGFIARQLGLSGAGSGRRIAVIALVAMIAGVALVGTLHLGAGGTAGSSDGGAASALGSVWGTGDPTGGLNLPDLITKGLIVLVLLFITLRVLGKVGTGTTKRGGRLEVLESRPLAPKASLHLVAIGDRRLVIGLTPSGMVSLAELDASEFEAEDALVPATEAASPSIGAAGSNAATQPTIGAALNSLLRPLDAMTGRLATFVSGGRVR